MKTGSSGFTRRGFLTTALGGAAGQVVAQECLTRTVKKPGSSGIMWNDVRKWGVEGKGWSDTEHYYDRLPARAKAKVNKTLWRLSRHSSGMLTRFRTDATEIYARFRLVSSCMDAPFMPTAGVSGLDLYAREADRDYWLSTGHPANRETTIILADGIDSPVTDGLRLYTVYLPLYNGIKSLEIGVPEGSRFIPIAPRTETPVVFYGTSIIHGASASRPGMAMGSILGRRLDRPVINLGFASNGRMETKVAELLCELQAAVYVIDCLPNMNASEIAQRCEPMVHLLHRARPDIPVLLVEDRTITNARFYKRKREHHADNRTALRTAYNKMKDNGINNLYYMEGADLMGNDGEASADGSHPTDLGMIRYADAYEKVLRNIMRG